MDITLPPSSFFSLRKMSSKTFYPFHNINFSSVCTTGTSCGGKCSGIIDPKGNINLTSAHLPSMWSRGNRHPVCFPLKKISITIPEGTLLMVYHCTYSIFNPCPSFRLWRCIVRSEQFDSEICTCMPMMRINEASLDYCVDSLWQYTSEQSWRNPQSDRMGGGGWKQNHRQVTKIKKHLVTWGSSFHNFFNCH